MLQEPSTHPAGSPRAGEQASADPQQVASAGAPNVDQSKGPSQSQEIKQLWLVECFFLADANMLNNV